MEDQTSQFKKHAEESRELAKKARSECERTLYEEMACHWQALAELWPRVSRNIRDRR